MFSFDLVKAGHHLLVREISMMSHDPPVLCVHYWPTALRADEHTPAEYIGAEVSQHNPPGAGFDIRLKDHRHAFPVYLKHDCEAVRIETWKPQPPNIKYRTRLNYQGQWERELKSGWQPTGYKLIPGELIDTTHDTIPNMTIKEFSEGLF